MGTQTHKHTCSTPGTLPPHCRLAVRPSAVQTHHPFGTGSSTHPNRHTHSYTPMFHTWNSASSLPSCCEAVSNAGASSIWNREANMRGEDSSVLAEVLQLPRMTWRRLRAYKWACLRVFVCVFVCVYVCALVGVCPWVQTSCISPFLSYTFGTTEVARLLQRLDHATERCQQTNTHTSLHSVNLHMRAQRLASSAISTPLPDWTQLDCSTFLRFKGCSCFRNTSMPVLTARSMTNDF